MLVVTAISNEKQFATATLHINVAFTWLGDGPVASTQPDCPNTIKRS
jgi:hypothetical protein